MVLPLLAFPCDEARMARLGRDQMQPVYALAILSLLSSVQNIEGTGLCSK